MFDKSPPRAALISYSHFDILLLLLLFFIKKKNANKLFVVGLAFVLTYLHQECEQQVIHRDIKNVSIYDC